VAILVSGAGEQPAVTYDHLHLTRMEIQQPLADDDASPAVYNVVMYGRYYGVLNGQRIYKPGDPVRIALDDYLTFAAEKAAEGDSTLIDTFQWIELAIAAVWAEKAPVASAAVESAG
jgi:hypothetical protein